MICGEAYYTFKMTKFKIFVPPDLANSWIPSPEFNLLMMNHIHPTVTPVLLFYIELFSIGKFKPFLSLLALIWNRPHPPLPDPGTSYLIQPHPLSRYHVQNTHSMAYTNFQYTPWKCIRLDLMGLLLPFIGCMKACSAMKPMPGGYNYSSRQFWELLPSK